MEKEDDPIKYDKEQLDKIREEISKSSQILGLRPISLKQINDETTKLLQNGIFTSQDNKKKVIATATKNVVMRFLRDKLKMDDKTRNNIEITKIYPSQNEDARIMYIQCSSAEQNCKNYLIS